MVCSIFIITFVTCQLHPSILYNICFFLQHVALNCSVVVSLIKQTKTQQTKAELVAVQRGLPLQLRVKKKLSISLIKNTPNLLTLVFV